MNSYKHELPKELFDGMDISNKDIDIDSCSDESIAFWIDTDYKFDKDLLVAYNERTGNDIIMPAFKDEKNPDVWLNTIYNLCKTKKGYVGTIDIESAGDFAEFDEFDVEDCIEMTEAETQRFIEVLESSFSEGIDQIFNEIQEHEMVLADNGYKVGEQVGISLKALFEANLKNQSLTQSTTCSLTYGHIRHSCSLGDEYYDYYDRMEDFMLCDGEVVTVKEITDTDVIFETDENFEFRFARDEAGVAIFKDAPEHTIKKNNIER